MAVDEREIDLLEMYLDHELSVQQSAAMEERLGSDTALRQELSQLENERQLRQTVFASLEPTEAEVANMLTLTRARMSEGEIWRRYLHRAGFATAAAAVVAIAFVGGWIGGTQRGSSVRAQSPAYHVQIMDDAGRIMAVQKFQSLEQAKEFSEDLQQWQLRQERLLSGQVTVKSADF